MPNYTQGYDRNTPSPKFYSTVVGHEGYNPVITNYYDVVDNLVRTEEVFRGKMFAQTISGTTYSGQWPSYSYSITYNAWEETTVS